MQIRSRIAPNLNFASGQLVAFTMFLLLFTAATHAQLPAFSLNVTSTDEICPNNGSLNFNVTGTAPGATVLYNIFLLPNITTPISTLPGNSLGGLAAGNYTVTATQLLGGNSNSQSQNITINSALIPLAYSVTSTNALCGNDASLTISITSGSGNLFEILSGPVTAPAQSSPLFTLLPAGVYEIRVFDSCGEALVTTHTIMSSATDIIVADGVFPDIELPSCDTITAVNNLSAPVGQVLPYPMTLQYTVYPPDGSLPVIINSVLSSGAPESQDASTIIPFYHDIEYHYDLVVTDPCGQVYPSTHIVDQQLGMMITPLLAECGRFFLSVEPTKYVGPFTLTFITSPAGFDPLAANSGYPGPFTTPPVAFGSFTDPVPFGDYTIEISDACGRTGQATVTLMEQNHTPTYQGTPNPGCDGAISTVEITLPGFTFVSAVITVAPAAYPYLLPHDVSDLLTPDDGLVMESMPVGNYTVVLIDDCDNEYIFDFEVVYSPPTVATSTRTDCDADFGSIRIRGNSTLLEAVTMTAAPAAYTQTLPYDVTFNIYTDGVFSMAELPAGNYTFLVTDNCGVPPHTVSVVVPGNVVTASTFTITPHCGSFDMQVTHASPGTASLFFWLQIYNDVTGSWEHPVTGVPYVEGTAPDGLSGLSLQNNTNNLNLAFTGTFRIWKTFEAFDNGSDAQFKKCFEIVHEFDFTGDVDITSIEKITCGGAFSDVIVNAIGVEPLIYSIVAKNGAPFFVNNGTNNIFTNLEAAVYTFNVEHACGDIAPEDADVSLLPSLASATQPPDMAACDDSPNDGETQFNLSDQNATILGTQSPTDFTVTFHPTLADAEAGTGNLPNIFTSGATTIFARVQHNTANCYSTTSFDLVVNPSPTLQMDTEFGLCEDGVVTISADSGYASYLWSTGATTRSITVSEPGTYTVEVTESAANGSCTALQSVEVTQYAVPIIQEVTFTDWTDFQNTITITLSNTSGEYLYSLDNVHFQLENTFTGLAPGPYTVYVKDFNECGFAEEEVYLLNYPEFFTPNADGYNDYWKVEFSEAEPNLLTYIFDRYGKLITGFGVDSPGWDGTLNGERLPSTDYWFRVVREDGKELRGHFSMKR